MITEYIRDVLQQEQSKLDNIQFDKIQTKIAKQKERRFVKRCKAKNIYLKSIIINDLNKKVYLSTMLKQYEAINERTINHCNKCSK